MRYCRGCGQPVDATFGANRGISHGGITNLYGSTRVFCYRTNQWEGLRDTPDEVIRGPEPTEIVQDEAAGMPWLDAAVRGAADRERRLMELNAWWAIPGSLRPRLRWAARRVRALRLLKWLRLWAPPTVYVGVDTAYRNESGHPLGRNGERTPDLHFVTTIHRVPEKMVWDPRRMRIVEADE